jgi:hypothetical protein
LQRPQGPLGRVEGEKESLGEARVSLQKT